MLLVLAVLAGLLAMHGLAPGGLPAGHAAMSAPSGTHLTPAASVHEAGDACEHVSGHGAGGHMHHADATCAAAGTSTAPAPITPALLPSGPDADVAPPGWPATPAAAGRAPPDLTQLQLLRI
ncbi:DUF6153 family protein [Streptomyces sp. SF28]|nr:DUF6153 family protein [Streptomyces pinistramenti]